MSLQDPCAQTLAAGDLEAVFLPGCGMLGASLRHRGVEILRRVDDLDGAAAQGTTAGIPLLHPWANRLAGLRYRVADQDVVLDPTTPLLHLDDIGLPIHGVPWSMLAWKLTDVSRDHVVARIEWMHPILLALFPFRHWLELTASVRPDGLTIATTLVAGPDGPVPVSFGFHPFVGLPQLPRDRWRLSLPPMRRLVLDPRRIPTGEEQTFAGLDAPLAGLEFDDGFALQDEHSTLAIEGAGRRISVDFLSGYRYAQVYAPPGQDYVALEPMTASTNALMSGRGLRLVEPGGSFHAAFRIRVATAS